MCVQMNRSVRLKYAIRYNVFQHGLTNHCADGMARGLGPTTTRAAMQKLRGTGTTFSTSGKDWQPFRFNPKLAHRNARLHRLQKRGLTPSTDKQSQRVAAELATANHPITRIL